MQKTIFYEDELNDEFSTAVIHAKKIDEHYKYGTLNFNWRLSHFIIYRIIATPIAYLFLKLKYHHKIINKEVMKNYLNDSFFLYANHTNATADALIPSFVSFPNHAYVIVHPNNVSMPVLGKITPSLGALPLPGDFDSTRNFINEINNRWKAGSPITIYPEAHIWPYYTKIRPFKDMSFRYAVQLNSPVFCFTNCYKKRKFGPGPKMVTFID